jgi:hypothetical protein
VSGTNSFKLQVIDVNHAPVAGSDSFTRLPNQSINISFSAFLRNDSDLDLDTLTMSAAATASRYKGKVVKGATFITYTPPANFNSTDSFTYTVRDPKGLTATGTAYIYVSSSTGAATVY